MRTLTNYGFCAAYIFVAVLPGFCQTIPAELWRKFSSPTAGFSILMPGEPKESISENHADAFYAEDVKFYAANVGLDAGSFSAAELIYPKPLDRSNDVSPNLDRFQSYATKNAHGKVVTQKDVTVQGMPGRRISIAFEINRTLYRTDQMFILKDNRLFHLTAMGGSAQLDAEDVEDFSTPSALQARRRIGSGQGWTPTRSSKRLNPRLLKSQPVLLPSSVRLIRLLQGEFDYRAWFDFRSPLMARRSRI